MYICMSYVYIYGQNMAKLMKSWRVFCLKLIESGGFCLKLTVCLVVGHENWNQPVEGTKFV